MISRRSGSSPISSGIEVTLARLDELGPRQVLLWKPPDLSAAATAALQLMAALADDPQGVLVMGDEDDDEDYEMAVTGFGTALRCVP